MVNKARNNSVIGWRVELIKDPPESETYSKSKQTTCAHY